MQIIEIESLRKAAMAVSPDRRYSLAWSWGGMLGILQLEDNSPLLTLYEGHGGILRAGFSPDMRRLLTENEDGTLSVWFSDTEESIVDYLCRHDRAPHLNVDPRPGGRHHYALVDISGATLDYYNWGNLKCR